MVLPGDVQCPQCSSFSYEAGTMFADVTGEPWLEWSYACELCGPTAGGHAHNRCFDVFNSDAEYLFFAGV